MADPNDYMYSEFGGCEFLQSYFLDRQNRLGQFTQNPDFKMPTISGDKLILTAERIASSEIFEKFDINEEVNLEALASDLLRLLRRPESAKWRYWLDKIVQRFEVTKKLYEYYAPGFRIGCGASDKLFLYTKVSLCVAIAYKSTSHLQYLSTLLKLVDLHLSLRPEILRDQIPTKLLVELVAFEVDAVKQLMVLKRVRCDL